MVGTNGAHSRSRIFTLTLTHIHAHACTTSTSPAQIQNTSTERTHSTRGHGRAWRCIRHAHARTHKHDRPASQVLGYFAVEIKLENNGTHLAAIKFRGAACTLSCA